MSQLRKIFVFCELDILEVTLPAECPRCEQPANWLAHGCYWRWGYFPGSERVPLAVPRFRCKPCGKTISCLDARFAKNRRYSLDGLLPLILTYLCRWISYEHLAWEQDAKLAPSTLWRWNRVVTAAAPRALQALQRRLVEAGVPLMQLARAAKECVNAAKARDLAVQTGLNSASAIVQMAQQFLTPAMMKQVIFPVDMYQRYPPQSSQYTIF